MGLEMDWLAGSEFSDGNESLGPVASDVSAVRTEIV